MYSIRRKLLSQNFLHNRKLVHKLVRSSSIGKNDLVLEIGPGKGIITEQLINKAGEVLAVEVDDILYRMLSQKFNQVENLTLYRDDILNFHLPSLPYKVFANIPFAIEGKIIRKLIDAKNPPNDCYLIMMKELAYRLSAPHKENMFSVQHKPWFTFSIYHHFRRTDFEPVPSVHIVMLRFTKREKPLLLQGEKVKYQRFVEVGFGCGQPLFQNLKRYYGRSRVVRVFNSLRISRDIKPAFLSLRLWIELYRSLENS